MRAVILFCVIALALAIDDEKKSCLEEAEEGLCRGYFESYYYDYKSRSCKKFVYGGCGGNGNRYISEEECMESCRDVIVFESESICDLPAETGNCFGIFPRFYFDKTTGTCKRFVFGGCGGNENNFRSKEVCESRCGNRDVVVFKSESVCDLPAVTGNCYGIFPRFYFDKSTKKCQTFVYGGCGGNENNFRSEEDCESRCGN